MDILKVIHGYPWLFLLIQGYSCNHGYSGLFMGFVAPSHKFRTDLSWRRMC